MVLMRNQINKIKNLILGPEDHGDIVATSSENKGQAFSYKGQEFVHHSNIHHFETAFFKSIISQRFVRITLL